MGRDAILLPRYVWDQDMHMPSLLLDCAGEEKYIHASKLVES